MNIVEEFTAIVENEAEVFPFVKKLDKAQKKDLTPTIKKLQKYYSQFIQKSPGSTSYSTRGTTDQSRILEIAAFVCFNLKEFEQSSSWRVFNKKELSNILSWYCPDWFNAYADELSLKDFTSSPFSYDWYMELVEQGYLQPNRQLIAKILPESIFVRTEPGWKFMFRPENLLIRDITLKEHIWYLFEFETNLHAAEDYKQFEDGSAPGRWLKCLKDFMEQGKMSRERLLREVISFANKSGNQAAANWFMDLFIYLDPSTPELIALQNDLLNTFNAASSKLYNTALKFFKGLTEEKDLDVLALFDNAPLVLTADSKTAVSSALMILDKLAKIYSEYREQICMLTCQALIHQDNALQIRAAKLIQKYGATGSEQLTGTIETYYDSLLSEARELLAGFSTTFTIKVTVPDAVPETTGTELVEIQMPETFDEFVFLVSQAFDQNETYHFDLLPAAVLRFQHEMTADNIQKLMPSFQRAYKMMTSDWTSTMGYLDNMLAKFWMSYGQLLISLSPEAAYPVKLMHQSFVDLENGKKAKWDSYKLRIGGIKPWDIYTHSLGYKPHKHILLNAFFLLERKISLPLLSTPTYEPCWVSPVVLVERLGKYQEAKVIPANMDLQVAIARCLQINAQEAIELANEKLRGEYRDLVGFILGEKHKPNDSYKLKSGWLVAAMTKNIPTLVPEWSSFSCLADPYLTGAFGWDSLIEDYMWKQYDYKTRAYTDVPAKRKIIRINFGEKQKKVSAFKAVLNKIILANETPELSIYDLTELKFEYISGEHNDIKRLLYLNPHQPEILLAHIINKGFRFIDFSSENDKKLVIYTLETLFTLANQYGEMDNLFIASCMISNDKTVRTYAAELWIKGVTKQTIDSSKIGEAIGIHERIELAPLKRFTDLVVTNMFQISQKHNHALENLLSACIVNMDDKPINGAKKLLEIYAEALSVNKSKSGHETVILRLNSWGHTETLAKPIQKIKSLLSL